MDINPFTIAEVMRDSKLSDSQKKILDKIQRIDFGLSIEDEFQAIIAWLGNCILSHKIENLGFHSKDYSSIIIPDLFVVFDINGIRKKVFVEVKSSNTRKLSWTEEYYKKLQLYQELTETPVLIAWKHTSFGFWTLNSIDSFKKARTNYHLSYEIAFQDNLLSYLAGDCAYQLCDNVGLHIQMEKIEKVMENDKVNSEIWNMIVRDAWFSDCKGEKHQKIPEGIWPLLIASELVTDTIVEEKSVLQSFFYNSEKIETNKTQFLHRALPIIIRFYQIDDTIKWREKLKNGNLPISGKELKSILKREVGTFSRYIFEFQPQNSPSF